jgi:hypothetical protein
MLLLCLAGLAPALAWAQADKEKPLPPTPNATITVTSTPVGARVYVGSEGGGAGMFYKGVTPVTVTIHSAQEEAAQRYRVTLTLPEYDSYTRMLEIRKGDALQVDAQMDPRCKRAYVQDGSIIVEGWQGGSRKVIAQAGYRFSWERLAFSPSGRHLAYAQMGELFLGDISWRQERQVTDTAGRAASQGIEGQWVCESPVWAADGRHLACILHSERQSQLLLVPVRVTAPDDLPGGGDGETGTAESLTMLGAGASPLATASAGEPFPIGQDFACIDDWRPGSGPKMLAAQTQLFTNASVPYSSLMLIHLGDDYVPLEGSPALPNAGQAAWSPDGSRLAYTCYDPAMRTSILYLGDGNGNSSVPVVQRASGRIRKPVWSPDGERVAYLLEELADGRREAIHVFPVSQPEADVEIWTSDGGADDEAAIRLVGFTPDAREVVFTRGAPETALVYGVPADGGKPQLMLTEPAGLFCYSSGLPSTVYRSLSIFRDHLLATLESVDVGRLGDLCLPVLEKVNADGKLVKELWEGDRASALAEILRSVGPSGVANASQVPYAGTDGRFEQVVLLGGSGRKLFLLRSDGRWYVGGFYLAP